MKALIVREPWIDLILDGHKTWELRTQPTSIRGRIALIHLIRGGLNYNMELRWDGVPSLSEAMASLMST